MTDPNTAFINLTYRCNNNCVSCIMENHFQDDSGITWGKVKDKIDQISKRSVHIEFNGGEPTLSPDLFRIILYARSKCKEIGLITNARVFSNPKNVSKLSRAGGDALKVITTLYGPDAVLHDAITRTPGSFVEQMEGIRNIIREGIPVELRVVLNNMNMESVPDIVNLIKREFSPDSITEVVMINMKPFGRALSRSVSYRVTEAIPYIRKAVVSFNGSGFRFHLRHFPLCVLPEGIRRFSRGITSEEDSISYIRSCDSCDMKSACPGIWNGYLKLYGEDEFGA